MTFLTTMLLPVSQVSLELPMLPKDIAVIRDFRSDVKVGLP